MLCQHTMMENNKDVILYTAPWQLLSCHYTVKKSFPCLTWKYIIMIKNNSEVSINAKPLLPHILSLETPTCSGFIFLVHSLLWSYYDHGGGHIIACNLGNLWNSVFLNLCCCNSMGDRRDVWKEEVIHHPFLTSLTMVKHREETWYEAVTIWNWA